MALIFSPLTEDVLESPYRPIPKGVFLMIQLGGHISELDSEMMRIVESVLKQRKFSPIRATAAKGHKDYLEKIIRLIRGCGFGVAVFSQDTPASTLANIFFEVALCNLLGTPVVIVKSDRAEPPSDFIRTEWVSFAGGSDKKFRQEFSESVTAIKELGKHFEELGDLAIDAEDVDLELAFERYRQSFLIDGRKRVKAKIVALRDRSRDATDSASDMMPARSRIRTAISQFSKLS